jgi:hypothetical protein
LRAAWRLRQFYALVDSEPVDSRLGSILSVRLARSARDEDVAFILAMPCRWENRTFPVSQIGAFVTKHLDNHRIGAARDDVGRKHHFVTQRHDDRQMLSRHRAYRQTQNRITESSIGSDADSGWL